MSYVFTKEQQQELSALIRKKVPGLFSPRRYRGECNLLSPLPHINLSGAAYVEYICSAAPADEDVIIRNSLARNQLTGDSRFIEEIERITGKRVEKRGRERQRKEKVNEK